MNRSLRQTFHLSIFVCWCGTSRTPSPTDCGIHFIWQRRAERFSNRKPIYADNRQPCTHYAPRHNNRQNSTSYNHILVNARFACSNFITIKSIACVAAFPPPKKFRVQPSFFGNPIFFAHITFVTNIKNIKCLHCRPGAADGTGLRAIKSKYFIFLRGYSASFTPFVRVFGRPHGGAPTVCGTTLIFREPRFIKIENIKSK